VIFVTGWGSGLVGSLVKIVYANK